MYLNDPDVTEGHVLDAPPPFLGQVWELRVQAEVRASRALSTNAVRVMPGECRFFTGVVFVNIISSG